MENVGKFITTIVILCFGIVWGAWVLSKLWLWFIVPPFALPVLTLAEVTGLRLIVAYLQYRPNNSDLVEIQPLWMKLAKSLGLKVAIGVCALGIGIIVKQFL